MSGRSFKVILFAHDYVGKEIIEFLLQHKKRDLLAVVLTDRNSNCLNTLIENSFNSSKIFFYNEIHDSRLISFLKENSEAQIILAWWPKIIKEPILSIPSKGIINFHPSYLPYNRGKDANFWTIIEETPFGVTLQIIDESIDGGDILFQRTIEKKWTDTGKSLYMKALKAIINLFIENYENIKTGNYIPVKQNLNEGSFHYRKELEPASEIHLNKAYIAKDLINLLRARTFKPHPSCYFYDKDGEKHEIRIEITSVSNNKTKEN